MAYFLANFRVKEIRPPDALFSQSTSCPSTHIYTLTLVTPFSRVNNSLASAFPTFVWISGVIAWKLSAWSVAFALARVIPAAASNSFLIPEYGTIALPAPAFNVVIP